MPPRPARDPSPPSSTHERILVAATQRFAKTGFSGTSLSDVADDVGIRTPSLYKHFASKRALYEAVVDRLIEPYATLLTSILVAPRSADDAEQNLVAIARHYLEHPDLARVVQHASLNGGEELELLAARWYEPIFARAAELTPAAPLPELGDQVTAIVIAVHSMLSGFATMAPLHARLLGTDPLGPEGIEQQLELLRGIARHFFAAYAPETKTTKRRTTKRTNEAS